MQVSDFHFDLPEELIAQHPPTERGASRMLVVDRAMAGNRDQGAGAIQDSMFRELPEFLRAGDLLVLNDSRVLPARLFATRVGLGTQAGSPRPSGVVEVLLVEEVGDREQGMVWRALVKPAKKVRVGERLEFYGLDSAARTNGPGLKPPLSEADYRGLKPAATPGRGGLVEPVLTAEVVGAGEFGERVLRFEAVEDFYGVVGRIGHMPLPPYIRREQAREADLAEDRERYQTVYSARVGSAAAPTAGLHFTAEVLAELRERGVEIATVTLHVGLGTFQPVRVDRVEDIRLHAERYTLPAATAEALNRALAEGRRVVAVGTTTTRVLEHVAAEMVRAGGGEVPGAKAQGDFVPGTPGLKSRPISEAGSVAGGVEKTIPGLKPHVSGALIRGAEAPRSIRGEAPGPLRGEAPGLLRFEAHSGATSIFIGPGHRFRVVSGLLTNFHLPESTLLMLVSAFAGRELVLAAYAYAVRAGYRFYSYGDCMLVV
jgi:S-adenosylmethionine:tRNA ribosyltransferase-isomerase